MTKQKYKVNFLLIVTFMLFSSASCSKNIVKTKDSIVTANKPEKIVAMLDEFNITQENGRQQLLNKYKELTGITLEIVQYPHNMYYDKVNLSFASGNLPDVVELTPSRNNAFITYFSQEALYDMTQDVAASDILSKANPTLLDSIRINGSLYGFPKQFTNHTTTYIRKDWLDKTGLPIPTNYTQFLAMLKAFTFNDVDGNGKNDTVGFSGTTDYRYLPDFIQDAVPDFQYKNKQWVDGFQQPEMESALERIRTAYNEGLIDKEIVTNNESTATNKFINGQVGTITYWANALNNPTNTQEKIIPLPAMQEVSYINSIPDVYAITSASENPKGVFKYFIEYLHDGGEGQNLFTYGVKGLTYEIKDGIGSMLPTLANPKVQYENIIFNPSKVLIPMKNDIFQLNPSNAYLAISNGKIKQEQLPILTDTYVKMHTDINQQRLSTFSKIMAGQYTIEEGLAIYSKKVNDEFQMEKILSELNSK